MNRILLSSKIHRAIVTGAYLHYIGSISIDAHLMQVASILPFEKVEVVNLNNGCRWETYAIEAKPGSGAVEVRGGGARLANVGDVLVIMTYAHVDEPVPLGWAPNVVIVDEQNRVREIMTIDSRGKLAHRELQDGSALAPSSALSDSK
jgi:aspartate 1-decarboxylase